MPYGVPILFGISAVRIDLRQSAVDTGQGLLRFIAGMIVSIGALQYLAAQFAVCLGTDNGQGGKGNQAQQNKYQQDRGRTDI